LASSAQISEETHWEKAAKTRMGKYLTQIETDFIFQTIDSQKTHAVMDVGAEAGRFSLKAADNRVTVVGIDIDAYSLKRLKQKNKVVALVQADARRIPLQNEAFDAVFMIEVLDYIAELSQTLEECFRILKSNSPLVLSFGNQSSMKAKLRGLRGKSYMHAYKEVMQCLLRTGFTVTKKTGYSWVPFGRSSDSRLVSFMAGLERVFGLRRIPSLSPWVIVCAVKPAVSE